MFRLVRVEDTPAAALKVLARVYEQMGYPVVLPEGGHMGLLYGEGTDITACVTFGPSHPDKYDGFGDQMVQLHEGRTVARVGTLAAARKLTRSELFILIEGVFNSQRELGYTHALAIVTVAHARAWTRLHGFEMVTSVVDCKEYGIQAQGIIKKL